MHSNSRTLPTIITESARARGAAVSLLAHLFQGMFGGRTLVIVRSSPPVFDAGAFSELLAFVVDALPSRYADRCRIGFPLLAQEIPPRQQAADLIVSDAGEAAMISPDRPVQVDEDGESLAGDMPDHALLDYAEAVMAEAWARPDALVPFGARFDRLLGDDNGPDAGTLALAETVYAISALFASPTVGAAGMLRRHLLPLASAADLPWVEMIDEHEWTALNSDDLSAWILIPARQLSAGEQTLQRALLIGLERTGWQLVDPAPPWRRPAESGWWERLWSLLDSAPGVLPASLLADMARGASLDEVPAAALAPLLAAELAQRSLWRRRRQVDALVAACPEPGVLPILLDAVAQGELDTVWLKRLVADADLIDRLPAAQLLRIAAFEGVSGRDRERACRALYRRMEAADPSDAVGALIETGAWSIWRRAVVLSEPRRKQLALAWMTHPKHGASRTDLPESWADPTHAASSPIPACTIETWRCVIDDLSGGLTADDIRTILGPDGRWPLIYPYARRQIEDFAASCVDPDALAELAERVGNDHDGPDPERLLAISRFSHHVSADAFVWLLADGAEGLRGATPPSLDATAWICTHVNERAAKAEDARVAAVTAALDHDLPLALQAASEPMLWGRDDFRQRALDALLDQRVDIAGGSEWLRVVEQSLDGVRLPAAETGASATHLDPARRRLVCDLVGAGLERLAGQLAGDLDLLHHCRVLHRAERALARNDATDGAWQELVELGIKASGNAAVGSSHPLIELAAMLDSETSGAAAEARQPALKTLEQALALNPFLLNPAIGDRGARLPLLHLIAALSGMQAPTLLPRLITGAACIEWAKQPAWRQAVIATLRDPGDGPLLEVTDRDSEAVVRALERVWVSSD